MTRCRRYDMAWLISTALLVTAFVSGFAGATEEETYLLKSPCVSRDGKTIIFVSDYEGDSAGDIYRIGIDGKGLKRLTDGKAWYSDPAWAPDGRTIACTKRDKSGVRVILIGVDGSKPRAITNGKYEETEPAWLPDGKKLVVTTTRNDNTDLILISSTGAEERYVAASREAEIEPDCSPDGKWVVYEVSDLSAGGGGDTYRMHIWKKSLSDPRARPIQLTTGSHVDSAPHFSPDGTKICFSRSRNGDGIYTMNSDGTDPRRIPIQAFEVLDPSWSPDGRSIVFVRHTISPGETSREEICMVSLDGKQLRQITNIQPLFHAPAQEPGVTLN